MARKLACLIFLWISFSKASDTLVLYDSLQIPVELECVKEFMFDPASTYSTTQGADSLTIQSISDSSYLVGYSYSYGPWVLTLGMEKRNDSLNHAVNFSQRSYTVNFPGFPNIEKSWGHYSFKNGVAQATGDSIVQVEFYQVLVMEGSVFEGLHTLVMKNGSENFFVRLEEVLLKKCLRPEELKQVQVEKSTKR